MQGLWQWASILCALLLLLKTNNYTETDWCLWFGPHRDYLQIIHLHLSHCTAALLQLNSATCHVKLHLKFSVTAWHSVSLLIKESHSKVKKMLSFCHILCDTWQAGNCASSALCGLFPSSAHLWKTCKLCPSYLDSAVQQQRQVRSENILWNWCDPFDSACLALEETRLPGDSRHSKTQIYIALMEWDNVHLVLFQLGQQLVLKIWKIHFV